MSNINSVLVVGATGQQGGAVVDQLLSDDFVQFEVFGLTRDAESDAARRLAERGVVPVEGDLTDAARLEQVLEGIDAVFAMTDYFSAGDPESEIEQGRTIGNVAADNDVDHYVYSSVANADRNTGIPFFETKHEVETHLRALDLPLTIVRPTNFMQNYEDQRMDIRGGTMSTPLTESASVHLVDTADIGRVVATVFGAPDRFLGETLPIAGDELTPHELAAAFHDAIGTPVDVEHLGIDAVRDEMGEDFARMAAWLNESGFDVDSPGVEETTGLELRTFEEYLRAEWA